MATKVGSFVKNPKEPYVGLCIVLEVDGSKVRTWSERGRYDVDETRSQLVEVSPDAAIFSGAEVRLRGAYANYQRRKSLRAYTSIMSKGTDARQCADYRGAAKLFTAALEIEPDSYEALSARAYCNRMAHSHTEAMEDYTRLIHEGSASDDNFLERALCWEALGRLDEACADAEASLSINKTKAQACDLLARVYQKISGIHERKAQQHEKRAREIRNPEGNLGPLFE